MLEYGHPLRVLVRMRCKRGFDRALVGRLSARDDCEILFAHRVVLELLGEEALRVKVLREQQDAARVFVEPVDQAKSRIGRSGRGEVQLIGQRMENALRFIAAGNGRKARGFLDGDEVGVVEENVQCAWIWQVLVPLPPGRGWVRSGYSLPVGKG